MVIVNDQKFACQSCIKGHRSSSCNHTDRPLFEIRKKGRPATQCDNCRDLRRLKRLHVKCACEGRRDPESETGPVQMQPPTSGNRFGRKIPLVPKLPNGVRDIDAIGSTSTQTPSVASSRSRSTSLIDERPESLNNRIRPARSCCRKATSSSKSNLDDKVEEDLSVKKSTTPLSAAKSPPSSVGLEFLHPQALTQSHVTPSPPKSSPQGVSHGMDCLCGPGCLCLGCTKHQQNGDGDVDTIDTIMHSGDCPPDCPSCIDNKCGAAWPASSGTFAPLLGRTTTVGSSSWFGSSTMAQNFELDLGAEGEYDDEMDAEGSPDPEFCKLPEEIPLFTKAARSTTKSCCAKKRKPSKLNSGIAESSLIDRGMRL